MTTTADKVRKETQRERYGFWRTRKAESSYSRLLRSIARHVSDLIKPFTHTVIDDPSTLFSLMHSLRQYADTITPWARVTAARMLQDVSRRDESAWNNMAKNMSLALRKEVRNAPTGETFRTLMKQQVELIRSIPVEAANRVHRQVIKAQETGQRAEDIAKAIAETGDVTRSRAALIARTEVARAASALVQARATHLGSDGYIWRTSMDRMVRESHRQMEGKFIAWGEPPELDGLTGHAGQLPNCRCWPQPVIPEDPGNYR